jgi:hypothetical protein
MLELILYIEPWLLKGPQIYFRLCKIQTSSQRKLSLKAGWKPRKCRLTLLNTIQVSGSSVTEAESPSIAPPPYAFLNQSIFPH